MSLQFLKLVMSEESRAEARAMNLIKRKRFCFCLSAGQNQPRNASRMQPISVKLPNKLEINKFAGNPSHWRSFWDLFQAAVRKHSHIEDVEKFNFLKGLLEGKAFMAISGLELSNESYSVVTVRSV